MAKRGKPSKPKRDVKAKKTAPKPTRATKPKPRQARLPGTADNAILEIERATDDYIEARDERMELSQVESDRKSHLLSVMKKHGKWHYQRGEYVVDVTVESEKVTARKRSQTDGDDAGDDPEPVPSNQTDGPQAREEEAEPFHPADRAADSAQAGDDEPF